MHQAIVQWVFRLVFLLPRIDVLIERLYRRSMGWIWIRRPLCSLLPIQLPSIELFLFNLFSLFNESAVLINLHVSSVV